MVVACTGFFDGVHKGHLSVVRETVTTADRYGMPSKVFTFWPHPRMILHQDAAKLRLLNTIEEKVALLKQSGIDDVVILPFNSDLSKLTAEEFFKELKTRYSVGMIIVGYDHRLGSDVNISREEMLESAERVGIKPISVEEYRDADGASISSTKIREQLLLGKIASANSMLGYTYNLEGAVVEGRRIGRTIGFPTANMKLYEPIKLLPSNGVYIVKTECMGGIYRGITNIGTRPTVNEGCEKTIETHILDFNEEIYGLRLKISFVERIRDEVTFASLEDLRKQLHKDKIVCEKSTVL